MSHAVVIGGSLGGLCAARALQPFYERVTVVERDELPAGSGRRSGTPQAVHLHVLMSYGRQALEELFPGFERRLRELGAEPLDVGADFAALRGGCRSFSPRAPSDLYMLGASRDLIESVVRERFRELVPAEVRQRTVAERLVGSARRVEGVVVRPRDGGPEEELRAELIVDAAGRASRAASWLSALGVEPPEEAVVDAQAGYSTRWYRRRAPLSAEWKAVFIDAEPPGVTRGAILLPLEDGRCVITIAGFQGDYPPTDPAEFSRALAALRSPMLAEVEKALEPLSPVHGYRRMENRRRHYERWSAPPGFVAVGDAACALNPTYGQGMSQVAACGRILGECARAGTGADLPRRFFAAQARWSRNAWAVSTGADFRFPRTSGERPMVSKLFAPYFGAVVRATASDAVVARRYVEVVHMLKPVASLLAPGIAARVLRSLTGGHR